MQRRLGWVLLGLGVLMIATFAWIAVTGLMARSHLTAMKKDLTSLRADLTSGNVTDAHVVAADLEKHAHSAHDLTTGPAWWAAAALPGVGAPVKTVRGISSAADALGSQTVAQLVAISSSIDPAQFKVSDHAIDLDSLINATPQLDAAVTSADAQMKVVDALPDHTWFGPVNSSVGQVDTQLSKLVNSLHTVDQAAHAAPTLLGYTGPQRYFVGFQNEAESRGTGGLPGAFGILVADHGKLTFTHFGNDGELVGVDSGLDFGEQYNDAWADFDPTSQYLNSDVDPDFSYAAQIWAAMWQKKSGEHVDGAISLDPTALSYLLAVTGPATIADGSQVSASNIVALTQSTVYAKYSDENARKAYLLQIATAVDQKLLAGSANSKGLYNAAAKAAGQRRITMWSSDKTVESLLSSGAIGGTIPKTTAPFVEPVVISYSANKLDYYLTTDVVWTSTGCGPTRAVTAAIKLTNNAPANLPTYVNQRTDDPPADAKPGDNRVMLYYVGTAGGSLDGITIDGQAAQASPGMAGNHPTYSTLVELPRGQTVTVALSLDEPAGSGPPMRMSQPSVSPTAWSVVLAKC